MSVTISGLGSGLPITDWIDKLVAIKQTEINKVSTEKATATSANNALSTIKGSFSSLLSALQKMTDAQFGSTSDVFVQNQVTSSDTGILSASVTSLASKQNLSVIVSQLATASKAQSTSATSIGAKIDASTKFSTLASGEAKTGNMSVYVDNQKYTVAVGTESTIGEVLSSISSQTGLWAGVRDGKIVIGDAEPEGSAAPTSTHNVVIGSNSDTTNFASVLALKKNTDGGYQSNQTIFKVNTNASLTGLEAGFATQVKDSVFKIGDDTFTVDSDTTLKSLLSEINSSDKAGVNASWDSAAGKLVLTSKTDGATNINIENISGNFTDVVGLTTSTYDENENVLTSKLVDNSQTLGDVAILKINGTEIISSSNTVTSDISGVSGLTLTLKAKSATSTTSTAINISADNSGLTSAINSFVSAFNTVISQSDSVTGADGYLRGESSLQSLRNNLRQTSTERVNEGVYDSLATIGITTGAIGAGIDADTDKLVVDAAKLSEALSKDPEAVKALLIGDGTNEGVISKLKAQVDGALDTTNGFFVARAKTYELQLTDYTDTITKKTDAMAIYKKTLEDKFNLMDQLIAKMQSQLSSMNAALKKS